MNFRRFITTAVTGSIAIAIPIAALADSVCPEPPPGMKWKDTDKNPTHEISVNGKPFVVCNSKMFFGSEYYTSIYFCPTFKVRRITWRLGYGNGFRVYDEWDVTDKNKNNFYVYKEAFDDEKTFAPKKEKIGSLIPQGCQVTSITELRSRSGLQESTEPPIRLVLRETHVSTLGNITVPTF